MSMDYRREHGVFREGDKRPKLKTFGGVSKTKQEFRKLTDINLMMKRCMRSGQLDHLSSARPVFADVSQIGDFRSVLQRMAEAREAFMRVPSAIRSRFNNDPAELVEFIQKEENLEESIKLGLIEDPKKKDPKPEPKSEPKSDPKSEPKPDA